MLCIYEIDIKLPFFTQLAVDNDKQNWRLTAIFGDLSSLFE